MAPDLSPDAAARRSIREKYLLVVRDNFIVVLALVLFVLPLLMLADRGNNGTSYPLLRWFPFLVLASICVTTSVSSRVRKVKLGLRTAQLGQRRGAVATATLVVSGVAFVAVVSLIGVLFSQSAPTSLVLLGSTLVGVLLGISALVAIVIYGSGSR